MNQQRHIIKRQTIEIAIDKGMDAWALQQKISRMVSAQLIPLIDRYCNEMSTPDQIHRIPQLELDLGKLDPDNFETDFSNKFTKALRRGLTEQIKHIETDAWSQHSSSAIDSHLELFSLFIRQGILPWWADKRQSNLPENSFDYLLSVAPAALRSLLNELIHDNHAMQRLICYFDNARLLALLELALPTLADFPVMMCQTLMAISENLAQISGVSASRCREQLWQAILLTAVITNPSDRLSLFRETATHWTVALGLSHTDLLEILLSKETVIGEYLTASIGEPPKQETSFDAEWQGLLAILNEYLPETLKSSLLTTLESTRQPNYSATMLAEFEARLKTHNNDLLIVLQQNLSEPLQQSLLTRLKNANDSATILAELKDWITEHETAIPASILLRLAMFDQLFHLTKNATLTPVLQANQKNPHIRNDIEELYIENAGLVILWPFLNQFFEKQGLIQEGNFINDAAMQIAVALLQYLATEDPDPPEYLLALNKLLCGMELDAVFQLETALTEIQTDECNNFLSAVIEQAPILNKMSVSGFRGSFLLRQGVLSSRDGVSLLQVERETFDVVLDRFPWGMDWVKLPWMPTALRVEW